MYTTGAGNERKSKAINTKLLIPMSRLKKMNILTLMLLSLLAACIVAEFRDGLNFEAIPIPIVLPYLRNSTGEFSNQLHDWHYYLAMPGILYAGGGEQGIGIAKMQLESK